MREERRTCIALLSTLLIINCLVVYEVVYKSNVHFVDEGGIIENITAFALLFSGILLFFHGLHQKEIELRLNQFFSTTCILLFLREVDVEDLDVPYLFVYFGSGIGRDTFFIGVYILIIILTMLKQRSYLSVSLILACVKSPVSVAVLSGCVCFLAGAFFESRHMIFVEELMEMNGALLIMLAALLSLRQPIYISNKAEDSMR